MATKTVSTRLLTRLPVYLDYIKSLPEETVNISATKVACALGMGEVMVRKDLAKVSDGVRRKLGYVRLLLIRDIEEYLEKTKTTAAVIVGAGKLGQALMDYPEFEKSGFRILAAFDTETCPQETEGGTAIYGMSSLDDFCRSNAVAIGIITVPPEQAQTVCDQLVDCGVRAIWNFAPVRLKAPRSVVVHSENLAASLSTLRMQIKN